jgi:hypothetical protein
MPAKLIAWSRIPGAVQRWKIWLGTRHGERGPSASQIGGLGQCRCMVRGYGGFTHQKLTKTSYTVCKFAVFEMQNVFSYLFSSTPNGQEKTFCILHVFLRCLASLFLFYTLDGSANIVNAFADKRVYRGQVRSAAVTWLTRKAWWIGP